MAVFESNLMKLYVGNLSFATTENGLRDLFAPHGTVEGEIYELGRADLVRQSVDSARKYNGFFCAYRLIRLGKPIQ